MAAIAPSEVWICIRPTAFARLHRTDRLQANPWRFPSRLLESRLNSNRLPHARSTCVIAHSEASDGEKPQRSLKKTSRNDDVAELGFLGDNWLDLVDPAHVSLGGGAHDGSEGRRAEAVHQLLAERCGTEQPPGPPAGSGRQFRLHPKPGQEVVQPHRTTVGGSGRPLQALAARLPVRHPQRASGL